MLPTLNEGGSPFLSIGQRSILTLVTVRFNIVVPSHRLGIPNFTSLNVRFSLTPRSSALLNNYLFVNLSKTQNYLTLKIMTIFFQIQNRSTRLIIILMFTCHHSWTFSPVTTSILLWMSKDWVLSSVEQEQIIHMTS